jgi:hypothetical protein
MRRQRPVAASTNAVMSKNSFRFLPRIGTYRSIFPIGADTRQSRRGGRSDTASARIAPARALAGSDQLMRAFLRRLEAALKREYLIPTDQSGMRSDLF